MTGRQVGVITLTLHDDSSVTLDGGCSGEIPPQELGKLLIAYGVDILTTPDVILPFVAPDSPEGLEP